MASKSSGIKKGDAVEFTRKPVRSYIDGSGEYGIASENERPNGSVMVELADESLYLAKYIHAYGWAGWLPEELEPVWMKYHEDYEDYGGF